MLPRCVPQGQGPCMKRGQQRLRPLLVSWQFLMMLLPILLVKKQMWGVHLHGSICQLRQGLGFLDGAGVGYEEPASLWTREYLWASWPIHLLVLVVQADPAA